MVKHLKEGPIMTDTVGRQAITAGSVSPNGMCVICSTGQIGEIHVDTNGHCRVLKSKGLMSGTIGQLIWHPNGGMVYYWIDQPRVFFRFLPPVMSRWPGPMFRQDTKWCKTILFMRNGDEFDEAHNDSPQKRESG